MKKNFHNANEVETEGFWPLLIFVDSSCLRCRQRDSFLDSPFMKEKLAALEGMLLGVPTYFLVGNIFAALCVAILTGAAGYAGQQIAKWIHKKIK